MAILLLIKAETARDGLQYLNDVVGIFNDDHQFSSTELEVFSFLTIKGSRQDVSDRIDQIQPAIEEAYKWESDGEYHWTNPDEETIIDIIDVYWYGLPPKRWTRLDEDFKFPVNVGELTAEEKQVLETVDINHPSVDSFIRKIIKDLDMLSGNNVEIIELRNSAP
jgi:hypothetical protein